MPETHVHTPMCIDSMNWPDCLKPEPIVIVDDKTYPLSGKYKWFRVERIDRDTPEYTVFEATVAQSGYSYTYRIIVFNKTTQKFRFLKAGYEEVDYRWDNRIPTLLKIIDETLQLLRDGHWEDATDHLTKAGGYYGPEQPKEQDGTGDRNL